MLLGEMTELPKKAGLARLEFDVGRDFLPYRRGRTIHLNSDPQAEFFALKAGEEFLYGYGGGSEVYFGGTDEAVFLTRLNEEPMLAFYGGEEEAFFEALVPPVIRRVSKVLRTPWVRQGDFYAIKWSLTTWEAIELNHAVYSAQERKREKVKSMAVFGTRHRFTGQWLQAEGALGQEYGDYDGLVKVAVPLNAVFAEGVLRAPSHKPLCLLGGPHLLAQMECRVDPGDWGRSGLD